MRKILQTAFIYLATTGFAVSIQAQPTLTAANSNPVVGNQYIHKECNYMAPGQAGANRTWNFAAAVATANTVTNDYIAKSSAPNGASFSAANVVARAKTNNTVSSYTYIQTSSTGHKTHGMSNAQGILHTMSNPIEIQLPMSYNNVKTDKYKGTYTTNNQLWTKSGTMTITYDGYGTVITPKGTFTNCIRLKIMDLQRDSTNFGGIMPYVINSTSESYAFYNQGTHEPIFRVGTFATFSGTTNFGMYMNNVTTGTSEEFATQINLNLYPNPASDFATIEYQFENPEDVSVSLTNMVGQHVKVLQAGKTVAGLQKQQFSVAGLPKGIYFVRIIAGDKIATRQLNVQ